jgi:hypothetical protein
LAGVFVISFNPPPPNKCMDSTIYFTSICFQINYSLSCKHSALWSLATDSAVKIAHKRKPIFNRFCAMEKCFLRNLQGQTETWKRWSCLINDHAMRTYGGWRCSSKHSWLRC